MTGAVVRMSDQPRMIHRRIKAIAKDSSQVGWPDPPDGEWMRAQNWANILKCIREGDMVCDPYESEDGGYWLCQIEEVCAGTLFTVHVALPKDVTDAHLVVVDIDVDAR